MFKYKRETYNDSSNKTTLEIKEIMNSDLNKRGKFEGVFSILSLKILSCCHMECYNKADACLDMINEIVEYLIEGE